jgi:hypothetical protein
LVQLLGASWRGEQLFESLFRHKTAAADFDRRQLTEFHGTPYGQRVNSEQAGNLVKGKCETRIRLVGGYCGHKNLPGTGSTCATAGRRLRAGLGTRTGRQLEY